MNSAYRNPNPSPNPRSHESYDIASLEDLTRRRFEVAAACYFNFPEFAIAVREIYWSTVDSDRGLRDIIMLAFHAHPADIRCHRGHPFARARAFQG